MTISIIGALISLVIICLLWFAVTRIMAAFGVGDPIATLVKVVFVVLVILWLLSIVGGFGPMVRFR